MKTHFPVVWLYIEIIHLWLIVLKYDFLIGFYSSFEADENCLDQKK